MSHVFKKAKTFLLNNLFVIAFLFSTVALASGSYNTGVMVQKRNAMTVSALGRAASFPGGFSTGPDPAPGRAGGMFLSPTATANDGTYLYVLDENDNRVSKFNLSTGAFIGWIGGIETVPTGGASGCTTAKLGSYTSGWCTGGMSAQGFTDGMLSAPSAMTIDTTNTYLYVATFSKSSGSKVNKYLLSTGAFIGWIGQIGVSPTGGAVGCAGKAVGTATPGWCTGGDGMSGGYDDGMYDYIKGLAADGSNLYIADASASRISKVDAVTGSYLGWVGEIGTSPTAGAAGCAGATAGTVTLGWCLGGTSTYATTTIGNGGLETPEGLFLNAGNLYFTDSEANFVGRLTATTGVFTGWIGLVSTSPTGGDAGCSGSATNAYTPGWCLGGSANISSSGSKGGMWYPKSIAIQGTTLYVSNYGFLKKYTLSTGAFLGWRGNVTATPTGGTAGCTAATSGNFTPGWCTGGAYSLTTFTLGSKTADGFIYAPSSVSADASGNVYVTDDYLSRIVTITGSTGVFVSNLSGKTTTTTASWNTTEVGSIGMADGLLGLPIGITHDGTYLYVAERINHRISRFNMTTGSFAGWIGIVNTSPTGGSVAGCNGAAVSSFTPGWCTGGTSKAGTGNGGLSYPSSIFADNTGSLYVVDGANSRISKYTAASGAFVGWVGKIATSPTGGVAGCNGKAVGTATPGWCTGGTSNTLGGTGDSMIQTTNGGFIYGDTADNLYVADYGNSRVLKFVASTGAFTGWIGTINISPTGGAAGCNGKASGTVTPGWCTGGTSISSTLDGGFDSLGGVYFSGTNIYVGDTTRIHRFNASTGVFTGWYGYVSTVPTGGDAGCTSTATLSETPGWCTGGSPQTVAQLSFVQGIAMDSAGYFYFGQKNAATVFRKNFSRANGGAFGLIASSPTGGAANCNGFAVGQVTPNWCTGAVFSASAKLGAFNSSTTALAIDTINGYLFVVDGLKVTRIKLDP